MLTWFKSKWANFEAWLAGKLPNLKTRITLALGSLGTLAAGAYAYLVQLPVNDLISTKTMMITMVVLNTLAYWLSNLTTRVEARQ